MGQENGIKVRLSNEDMQLAKQIAQSRFEHRLSVEEQFAEQHPELWEKIRAELQKFYYYNKNSQRIEDDPEFCEQAIEDLGLIRETFEKYADTPERVRSLVARIIESEIFEYCKAAGKWGLIEWGRISWRPDTGLDLRKKETNEQKRAGSRKSSAGRPSGSDRTPAKRRGAVCRTAPRAVGRDTGRAAKVLLLQQEQPAH